MHRREQPSRTVPIVMFGYSCCAFLLGLCSYISTLITGRPALPAWATSEDAVFPWLSFAFTHVVVAYFTFEPFHFASLLPRYRPLFHADRDRIRLGQCILAAPAATCLYWLMITPRGAGEAAFWRIAISGYMLIPAFFAVHWAFQPENVFPQWFLDVIYNSPFQSWTGRMKARRHAIPLHEWLTGLTACCEKAVTSERLVNAKDPGPGEIDCLEFQCEMLYELESRACLIHHKKLLSQDGFREIRRFVQAVDNLDHKSTNELSWPVVLQSAHIVLSLKGRLTNPED